MHWEPAASARRRSGTADAANSTAGAAAAPSTHHAEVGGAKVKELLQKLDHHGRVAVLRGGGREGYTKRRPAPGECELPARRGTAIAQRGSCASVCATRQLHVGSPERSQPRCRGCCGRGGKSFSCVHRAERSLSAMTTRTRFCSRWHRATTAQACAQPRRHSRAREGQAGSASNGALVDALDRCFDASPRVNDVHLEHVHRRFSVYARIAHAREGAESVNSVPSGLRGEALWSDR